MSGNAEEAALLSMDDIELKSIQIQRPNARRFSGAACCAEQRVRTDSGEIIVAVQGDRNKPTIITYHDIGLNNICMQAFFNREDMKPLLQNFCVYHITAVGQEDGAASLPDDYHYPTMNDMAHQINYVMGYYGIKTFIGFGVGAGANILARFALSHPSKVEALILLNCSSTTVGWIEWGYQKVNARALKMRGMTQGVIDYLVWHHFGRDRSLELSQTYRNYYSRNVNPANLAHFIYAYVNRSDLGVTRDKDNMKVPVLNITGVLSPHVEDVVTFNSRLNPHISTWMKVSDCAMVLEEKPAKVAEAFRLLVQGLGYAMVGLAKVGLNSTIGDV